VCKKEPRFPSSRKKKCGRIKSRAAKENHRLRGRPKIYGSMAEGGDEVRVGGLKNGTEETSNLRQQVICGNRDPKRKLKEEA